MYSFGDDLFASEPVWDARSGVWDDDGEAAVPASFKECGFTLERIPSAVRDWADLGEVEKVYLPELAEGAIRALSSSSSQVSYVIFWHPNLRDTAAPSSKPSGDEDEEEDNNRNKKRKLSAAPIAAMAHIDTDMNGLAGDCKELVRFIERNAFGRVLDLRHTGHGGGGSGGDGGGGSSDGGTAQRACFVKAASGRASVLHGLPHAAKAVEECSVRR